MTEQTDTKKEIKKKERKDGSKIKEKRMIKWKKKGIDKKREWLRLRARACVYVFVKQRAGGLTSKVNRQKERDKRMNSLVIFL